jgi:hypothetical protein
MRYGTQQRAEGGERNVSAIARLPEFDSHIRLSPLVETRELLVFYPYVKVWSILA